MRWQRSRHRGQPITQPPPQPMRDSSGSLESSGYKLRVQWPGSVSQLDMQVVDNEWLPDRSETSSNLKRNQKFEG